MLGVDTLLREEGESVGELFHKARAERRILLTRDRKLAERRVWLVGWETTCEGQSDDYQEGERARKDVLHTRHKSWTKDSSQGPLWAEADKLR